MRMRALQACFVLGWIALAPTSAIGQVRNGAQEADPAPVVDARVARTSDVNAGRVGQRQTREDAAQETGIEPMARINSRIANRVQARLRNRIDRNYDPQANAAAPFAAAEAQTRGKKR
jgi:hypothetical protein